jgi:BirA family transcriptional regulator, biotin operon repressor / biotin---[acetyl-CoA-carboxylase] ligase
LSYISRYDLQNTAFLNTSTDRTDRRTTLQELGLVTYHFPVIDSTNAVALKLLSEFRPKQGTIVWADDQTAGRGQIGRTWHSAPGLNLCISIILYPNIRPQDQFFLSMAAALAVRDTILHFSPGARTTVKWPNDVYVDDLKIAGILIQNAIQGNKISSCIVGIGINVNETAFPAHLPNPTSLQCLNGVMNDIPVYEVADMLISSLSVRLAYVKEDTFIRLSEEYHQVLHRKDVSTSFYLPAKETSFEGRIRRVDDHGRLVIEDVAGRFIPFQFREIEFLISAP